MAMQNSKFLPLLPAALLLLCSPLWALVVTQDAQGCGGFCQGGPVSHRGGQVISCSERPPSLTDVSAVRSPPSTSAALHLPTSLSKKIKKTAYF